MIRSKLYAGAILLVFLLACNLETSSTPSAPAFDPTKAALEFQATRMAQQLTEVAQPAATQEILPVAPAPQATSAPLPTEVPPTATLDVEAKIKDAKVLVYENTDARNFGLWIKDALNGLGIRPTHTGSYSGRFMEYLNSGTEYDLIIVGAEDKNIISGEFWDVINTRLTHDKAALIMEVWYLDTESNGPISKILGECGVKYEKDYQLADSIYWWEPTHPIFNEPNVTLPLLHYSRYWANQTGDQIRLSGTGDATLLAGLAASPSNHEAVLATCMEGRVIVQTFSDHDYHAEDVIPLWENYVHYTLKNHFLATE
ncbi:MAG: hypothetical protein Fur002_07050 [Anaerolineales bacterium]